MPIGKDPRGLAAPKCTNPLLKSSAAGTDGIELKVHFQAACTVLICFDILEAQALPRAHVEVKKHSLEEEFAYRKSQPKSDEIR